MSDLLYEIRHALRQIAQRKVSSSVIVALIALGIGANTLLFSFVDGILLKSLPVRDVHNLFQIEKNHEKQIRPDPLLLYPEYQALRRSKVFESLYGEFLLGLQPLLSGDEQRLITVESVSTNFFSGLGVKPKLGRVFTSSDATAGSIPAVVSYDSGEVSGAATSVCWGVRFASKIIRSRSPACCRRSFMAWMRSRKRM